MARTWVVVLCGLLLVVGRAVGSDLRRTAIVAAVQRARPAVVNIRGEKTLSAVSVQLGKLDSGRRVNGMGTGVIIDPRGYIITNHHVVEGVREIQVTTADGEHFVARLVARDPETDLAIIKVDSSQPLAVIQIGTSTDLMPGEPVVAVGNAYGYEHTVTRGIVSALHRAVQVSDAQFYEDLIQTDASINPGNSGGPLLNIDGQMIGLNVAVRAGAQGIGFAIPVDKVVAVAADLFAGCCQKSHWHGVSLVKNAVEGDRCLAVESLDKDSPALAAGLKPGDVIAAVEDASVERALDFHRAMLDRKPGEQVQVTVKRGEELLTVRLALAEPVAPAAPSHLAWDLLGMDLKPIAPEDFRQQYQTRYRGGLTVTAVRPQSPAAAQGIRRGDVLVGMHVWETISLDNVTYIVSRPDFATLNPVKFYILRGNETLYGYLPVTMKATQQR